MTERQWCLLHWMNVAETRVTFRRITVKPWTIDRDGVARMASAESPDKEQAKWHSASGTIAR